MRLSRIHLGYYPGHKTDFSKFDLGTEGVDLSHVRRRGLVEWLEITGIVAIFFNGIWFIVSSGQFWPFNLMWS